jgi:outer membrane lipoprotein-sorting protein
LDLSTAIRILAAVLCTLPVAVNARAEDLQTILGRMDKESLTFKAMMADVQTTTFTKVIDETTVQNGKLRMQRQKGKGTRAILDFSGEKDSRVIWLFNNTVRFYYPKLKLYQDIDVGKSSDVLNQFLLLGFGSSGQELMENYEISNVGTETIAGQESTKLMLEPKSAHAKETLIKVEVWIPQGAAYPIQQQFFKPSGNYVTVLYSDIKLNPPIKGTLEFKLPPGTKKQGS